MLLSAFCLLQQNDNAGGEREERVETDIADRRHKFLISTMQLWVGFTFSHTLCGLPLFMHLNNLPGENLHTIERPPFSGTILSLWSWCVKYVFCVKQVITMLT